jgi:diketogulonate reductase-like aldo/keto reductase
VFLATKVWTRGREAGVKQIERSMQLLRTEKLDLMQVHNLLDWRIHLATLRDLKSKGRIRYIGVTHYTSSAYRELEAVMRSEKLDFVQVNYSADDRTAEERILPLAADRGMAVLINLPFGGGGLLRRLRSKPLPEWAVEIDCRSWAQVLLKFVLGNPAVTCVIPGTSNPDHMRDNAEAGVGAFLNEAQRQRIIAALNA